MSTVRLVVYIFLIGLIFFLHDWVSRRFIFDRFPSYKDYKKYVDTILIFVFGWILIKIFGKYTYEISRRVSDEGTAKILKSISEIFGFAVLLSVLASFLNVSAAASLTLGSFLGMVFGFASQTVLKNAIAGIFIAILKPIKVGDRVILLDSAKKEREGIVKEIRLMYVVLENEGEEILIPSSYIIENTIRRLAK